METTLSERELAVALSNVLDRARAGERFVVERDGEPLAIITPLTEGATGILGSELAARLGHLRMPGDDFADDIEEARCAVQPNSYRS